MKNLIYCALFLFCFFAQSSELLVFPTNTVNYTVAYEMVGLKDQYKPQSLLLNIQNNGDRCFEFELADSSVGASFNPGHLSFLSSSALKDLYLVSPEIQRPYKDEIINFNVQNNFSRRDWSFEYDLKSSDGAQFLVKNKNQSCYLFLPDAVDSIKEFYFNHKNSTFYYLNNGGFIRYVDCIPLLNEYADLYKPIISIKNASFLNILVIFTNLAKFLKNYFFNALGNQRLKNSLSEVFFLNAVKVFFHIGFLYSVFMYILWQKNISCKNIFLWHVLICSTGYILWNPITYLLKYIAGKIVKKFLEIQYF